ncbi:hypothetical protein [Streptomyces sp. NPDC057382]|uniref:hypothetical protein n=1 Tax=unclassified Streptomyces TaxID=2593676 RepID=UPI00363F5044
MPPGWAAQLTVDGYRTFAGRWADGLIAVRPANGTALPRGFPEAARRLPGDTAVECADVE